LGTVPNSTIPLRKKETGVYTQSKGNSVENDIEGRNVIAGD